MKKLVVSLLLAGVLVAAFGFVSTASAQGPVDQVVYGQGMGRGGNGYVNAGEVENEFVHDAMMEAWSDALGISVEEIEAREEAGETLSQIALSAGISFEDFWTLKDEINLSAADQALAAGQIDETEYAFLVQANQRVMGGNSAMRGTGYRATDGTPLGTGYRATDGTPLGTGTGDPALDGTGFGGRRGAGQLGTCIID